jgi:hypothetical protein
MIAGTDKKPIQLPGSLRANIYVGAWLYFSGCGDDFLQIATRDDRRNETFRSIPTFCPNKNARGCQEAE